MSSSPPSATAHATAATDRHPRELLLLLALSAMQFTQVLDFMIMMPLGTQFMRLFALEPREFALLVSSYTFAAAASTFVVAFRIDRFGRKRALLTMYSGFIVATALCGLATSYPLLLLARVVAGMFGGVVGALVLTIVADLVAYERRARATALVAAGFSLAAVLGIPLGLWLATQYSWRAPFLVLAIFSLVVGIVAWRLLPPLDANVRDAHAHDIPQQLRAIFGVANHLRAFGFLLALLTSVFMVVPFLAPYMVANVGLLEADLPYIYFAGGLATLFTVQIIGRLADRFGKKRVFAYLGLLSILPILLVTHLPQLPLPWVLATTILFFVCVPGRFGPAQALVTGSVVPRLRGSFMSFSGAVQQLGAALASFTAGLIIGRTADGSLTRYGWAGWCAVAATLLAIYLARRIAIVPDGSRGPE